MVLVVSWSQVEFHPFFFSTPEFPFKNYILVGYPFKNYILVEFLLKYYILVELLLKSYILFLISGKISAKMHKIFKKKQTKKVPCHMWGHVIEFQTQLRNFIVDFFDHCDDVLVGYLNKYTLKYTYFELDIISLGDTCLNIVFLAKWGLKHGQNRPYSLGLFHLKLVRYKDLSLSWDFKTLFKKKKNYQ